MIPIKDNPNTFVLHDNFKSIFREKYTFPMYLYNEIVPNAFYSKKKNIPKAFL